MSTPDLVLYNYWRSSSSHRVRIALELKGLPYRYEAVNLRTGEQSSEAHRSRSPTGFVPCLFVEGTAYVESVAIVELLDERFPEPRLLPVDPHARARVRALVEIVNSGIQPFHNLGVLKHVSPDASAQQAWARHFIDRGLRAFEIAMERHEAEGIAGPFAFGASPTLADVFLVPQLVGAARFKVDVAPYARVSRAAAAAMQLDAFQRAAPERQPDAVAT
jgi:maleylacetoacetate isomerase